MWRLPLEGAKAAPLLSTCALNCMLTGVAFCGEGEADVAAIAYDGDDLMIWQSVVA